MSASFNLAAHVLETGHDDALALVVVGHARQEWSYGALRNKVRRVAGGLLAHGLRPGQRVLMRIGNHVDFPLAYLSSIYAGLVPVPTSAQLTVREADMIAAEVLPDIILATDGVALSTGAPPVFAVDDFSEAAPMDAPHLGDPERPGYIIYTSGTSGKSRAVVHAHRAILAREMMFDGWYGLRSDDRVLHAGAFNWTYTLGTGLMDPWRKGATALVLGDDVATSDIPAILAQERISIFAAAPGVYRRVLKHNFAELPALRHGLSAGEKLPAVTRDAWQKATGTAIHEAYGMSECSTFISGSPMRPAPEGTLGFAQEGRNIALIGADGPGNAGQIAVHRTDPGLMLGYLDQPQETAAKMYGDWFMTGDIGTRTSEGAIRYEGRADDMMNAGGTRVSPLEVEAVLQGFMGITEVACAEVRLRDDLSLIAAFYTGPNLLDEGALSTQAHRMLAAYKVPRMFVQVKALPRGANNKLLRRKLAADWEAEHGQT